MFNLYKANVKRSFLHIFYLLGLVIALIGTFASSKTVLFPFLQNAQPHQKMFFVSAAMVAFYTIFTPVFTNIEYSDGVIRNKVIAGYRQTQIYFGYLFANMTSAVIMWGAYMVGGILGGARLSGKYVVYNAVILFAVLNYVSTMQLISFRLRKLIPLVITATLLFQACFTGVMMGNLMIMYAEGSSVLPCAILYNISALGQYFSMCGFADEAANPGAPIQILISLVVILLTSLVGTIKLNDRDLL
ncbi:MAG: hypothetical protein K5739_05235 [Lachnospiraceae bacterium]|nr:hypothetical protein [Lachnospiraceae bacterium]